VASQASETSMPAERVLFMLCISEQELFYITSETSCRGSLPSFPYKTVSKLTTVSAAVWDAALASE